MVIERDGLPVGALLEPDPGLQVSPGCTLVRYVPETQAQALHALVALLRATGDAARVTAYSDATRPPLRPIFAGRSDGFAVAADWLAALLAEGTEGPLTADVPSRAE